MVYILNMATSGVTLLRTGGPPLEKAKCADVRESVRTMFSKVFEDSATQENEKLRKILGEDFAKDEEKPPFEMVSVVDYEAQCVLEVSRWIDRKRNVGGTTVTLKQCTEGFNPDEQQFISSNSLQIQVIRNGEVIKNETMSNWLFRYSEGQGIQHKYPRYSILEYTSEELSKPQTEIKLQLIHL